MPRGAGKGGTDADAGVDLGWRDPAAAARVREKLERMGKEEKRWNVLENRMVVVGWNWGMGDGEWGMGNGEWGMEKP